MEEGREKNRNLLLLSWLLLSRARLFRKILDCRHSWGFTIQESFDSLLISFHQRKKGRKNGGRKTTFWFDFKEGAEGFFFLSNRQKGGGEYTRWNTQKCRLQQKQREKQSRASTDSEEKVRDIIEAKVMNAVGSGLIAIIIPTTTSSNCFCGENLFHWPLKFV